MNTTKTGCLVVCLMAWTGCGAQFVDERSLDRSAAGDTEANPDAQVEKDASRDLTAPAVLTSGTWEGRKGYAAEGTVELVRNAQGNHVLQLGDDFSVSGVPAPVVVVSEREALGTKLEPQDLHLGELSSNSGAQQYELPSGTVVDQLRYAWVFCEPFGVEVARADLR